MGKYSRRAALGMIAGGASLWIHETGAFSSIVGDRRSDVNRAGTPSDAIIGLQGGVITGSPTSNPLTEPQTFTIKNNSPTTFTSNDPITIGSKNDRFRFRLDPANNLKSSLDETDLDSEGHLPFDTGDSFDVDVVTASGQSGTVTDAITLNFDSGTEGLIADIAIETSLQFRATGQLVYANKGDIFVYDTVNETVLDPPEDDKVNSVGSSVADITGDGDADIAYTKKSKLDLTQADNSNSGFPTTVFDGSNNKYEKPNKNKTRVAAGDLSDWPLKNNSGLSEAVALYADNSSDELKAAQPDSSFKSQAVETLVDTSNVGGAQGVTGVEDIDADGSDELVYIDSSQQLNFIKQIDTTQFSSPSAWVGDQANYEQVLPNHKDGNGNFINNTDSYWQTKDEIALGKAKLGNATVGSNSNVGISAPGNFSSDNKKYIPFIDGSQQIAFIDHTNTKTTVTPSSATSIARKSAIAPVDINADDTTELAFIGITDKSGSNGPLPAVNKNIKDSTGPVYVFTGAKKVLDNNGQADGSDFELLQPPGSEQTSSNGVVQENGGGKYFIVPDGDIGLNAGTVIGETGTGGGGGGNGGGNTKGAIRIEKPKQDQDFNANLSQNNWTIDEVDVRDDDGDDDLDEVKFEVSVSGQGVVGSKTVSNPPGNRYNPQGTAAVTINPNAGYTIQSSTQYTLTTTGTDADGNFATTTVDDTTSGGGGGSTSTPSGCTAGASNNPGALQFNNLQNFTAQKGPDRWTIGQVQVQDADNDDDLNTLQFEITDSGATVRATKTTQLSGQQYQEKNIKIDPDDPSYDVPPGETYTLTVTVCDVDGNARTETKQATA